MEWGERIVIFRAGGTRFLQAGTDQIGAPDHFHEAILRATAGFVVVLSSHTSAELWETADRLATNRCRLTKISDAIASGVRPPRRCLPRRTASYHPSVLSKWTVRLHRGPYGMDIPESCSSKFQKGVTPLWIENEGCRTSAIRKYGCWGRKGYLIRP